MSKLIWFSIVFCFLFDSALAVTDESINFQPGINLYQNSPELKDLFGTHGSQLCGPIAVTHAFNFLKYKRTPSFPNFDLDESYDDQIRYFFSTCKTDRETGTNYLSVVACMQEFMSDSGYTPWTQIVGPHAQEAPFKTPLTINHIRTYINARAAVIMRVGWYKLNPVSGIYERTGGHYYNVYGYDYNLSWKQDQVILKAVNSLVDYSNRKTDQMFDDVTMSKIKDTEKYPASVAYTLSGVGFNYVNYKTVAEDIFVMLPKL